MLRADGPVKMLRAAFEKKKKNARCVHAICQIIILTTMCTSLSLSALNATLPFKSQYFEGIFVSDRYARRVRREAMHHYLYRGKPMKRAPKNEFYYPACEDKTYKWGQQTTMYPGGEGYTGKPMPPWMVKIADKIRAAYNQEINHAIIIKYDSGTKTHAPPHQDKVPEGTSFFVFSFGKPRRFDVLASKVAERVDATKRDRDGEFIKRLDTNGSIKTKMAAANVVWSKELAHNSLLVVDGQTNDNYYHAIPKDKGWSGERWSLIFRVIK
jgi:alkylated DNA repair dioxygenase AlkB